MRVGPRLVSVSVVGGTMGLSVAGPRASDCMRVRRVGLGLEGSSEDAGCGS